MEILYLLGFCILWFITCLATMYLLLYDLIKSQSKSYEIRVKDLQKRRADLEYRRSKLNVSRGS